MSRVSVSIAIMLLLMLSTAAVAMAQQATDIELDSPVRGLEIDPTRGRVDLDVNLFNRSEERRTVRFALEGVPEGWDVGVWSRFFDFRVTEFVVEPTAANPDRIQQVRIRIIPATEPAAGEYSFTLRVTSQDGTVEYEQATYTIRVREAQQGSTTGPVSMRSEIPVLQGPPATTMGFEIIVRNDSGEEASFNLAHQAPTGWQVTFREPFGEQRVIGAVNVQTGLTERVRVDVRAPTGTTLGEYEIPVSVSSEQGAASIALRANIVGRGELRTTTTTGLLSFSARAGGDGSTIVKVINQGTAELRDIRLVADTPANWTVNFDTPNSTIESLPAGWEIDIPVRVSPPGDAISGDYMITVRTSNQEAATSMNLRVTVTQSTIWGWLGIVLVVLVVGGMIGLFLKLGRR